MGLSDASWFAATVAILLGIYIGERILDQSHKEKSVKGGHRPQRLPLILFFVGYNAGGENGCPSVSLLPPVLHCPFRRKKVKGGLRPFFICCTR